LRGTVLALPEGQLKAARAIGMSDTKAIIFVILPQALRLAIPAWANEYTIIMKNSAVTYALGVAEIMARANHVAARTYQHFWLYLLAGFIFLALTYTGTRLLNLLERKISIKGYAQ
jgi:polar amino acid transport system permease protein